MAVYNNRYYPTEKQTTWADLAAGNVTWADGSSNWNSWSANTDAWTYTVTDAIDLGSVRTCYPISSCEFDRTDANATCLIGYSISGDDITYSNVSAGVFNARYVKTQVTLTNSAWLSRVDTELLFDTQIESFANVDTSTLSGTVDSRVLPLATIGSVNHVSVSPSIGQAIGPSSYQARYISYTAGGTSLYVVADYVVTDYVEEIVSDAGLSFVLQDLDTWSKANVDATVDFVVQGYPQVEANVTLGIVSKV